ncbi:GNAT family N-acetyltransferase [Izhakiella australiensis]|uniref:GNAT family N-acetyltransferase n=1 Tax=Izhakiella australiensis TaxID=1926881 RepID=A0A1S8YKG9_9GAMM|nr:GNAT family protein [Izhakiella australiensis]OON39378.1 GNAT family N-acetyltransferase [Izhakiella australiensis]
MSSRLQLTSDRLICTQIEERDWAFYQSLLMSSQVQYYISDIKPAAEIRAGFESRLPPWTPGSKHWLCLVVREANSGKALGVTGYVQSETECAEVGFLFAPEAQGKGFAGESLLAVCDFAFTGGGIRRLSATVTAGNLPSRRLLEKTGFVIEGELRESYRLRNAWHNDWLFGLLRRDYFSRRPRD